ncbi:MAG TPA: amidohydrolase [Pirellulales bacterium]|nr:amidohydrolase [Pirellulales bacterium]
MSTIAHTCCTWSGRLNRLFFLLAMVGSMAGWTRADEPADLILEHGKIATVDDHFTMAAAMAVRAGRILAVGDDRAILKYQGPATEVIDLHGQFVIPGLIDSHTHPTDACMTEFDHPIPDMRTIADVLDYVKSRAAALGPGKWVEVSQVFITRLKEQRYPTRAELDAAAPQNPVVFATGPDASLNSLALTLSGIDKNFVGQGNGFVEKDSRGEPTGILRSCTRYVKAESAEKHASEQDRYRRLVQLFADYNSVGITAIADRDASGGALDRYRAMDRAGDLSVRVAVSRHLNTDGDLESIRAHINQIAADPLVKGDDWVRIVGVKTYLDGGMLTGSAYMRDPWGVSQIYSIRDPHYRGVLLIPHERLLPIVRATFAAGLQFTAHSVGDGAVHQLLSVYAELNEAGPIRDRRPCITHSNFMSAEAVAQAAKLGVVLDMQPVWLYLDAKTLVDQFGRERLRYFQPLKSIFEAGIIAGGGSDHMQKIGARRSINPYDPFLGIATAVTRRGQNLSEPLDPEQALTRAQALQFYTRNNAFITFRERDIGSLEPGKLADFVLLDTDLLTCSDEALSAVKVAATYLGGQKIFPRAGKVKRSESSLKRKTSANPA